MTDTSTDAVERLISKMTINCYQGKDGVPDPRNFEVGPRGVIDMLRALSAELEDTKAKLYATEDQLASVRESILEKIADYREQKAVRAGFKTEIYSDRD